MKKYLIAILFIIPSICLAAGSAVFSLPQQSSTTLATTAAFTPAIISTVKLTAVMPASTRASAVTSFTMMLQRSPDGIIWDDWFSCDFSTALSLSEASGTFHSSSTCQTDVNGLRGMQTRLKLSSKNGVTAGITFSAQ